jgi:hypothetical protein
MKGFKQGERAFPIPQEGGNPSDPHIMGLSRTGITFE